MNIAVAHRMKPVDLDDLADAAHRASAALSEADDALDKYIAAIGNLIVNGVEASATINRPSCLVSPRAFSHAALALSMAMQAQAAHAEMHRSLHEDAERLAPDDAQKSGGGGKEPPPKP